MTNNQEINFTNKITFANDIEVGKTIDELFVPGATTVTVVAQEARYINGMMFFTVQFKSTATNAWQQLLKFKGNDYRPVKIEAVSIMDTQAGTNVTGLIGLTGTIQNITTIVAGRTYYITGFYFIK